ncbi:DUF1800 domain-containing protein [Nitrogeniibacter aestuarii]|uniref:DUF1800 domain-containing protein n=1 Tax=Nitrogeniibacter aestuarii TaxID=2815343 RepID=UPI001D1157C7|nr:DUF1800 domain-containing protein [Nitrogeniibacter aestuarii]
MKYLASDTSGHQSLQTKAGSSRRLLEILSALVFALFAMSSLAAPISVGVINHVTNERIPSIEVHANELKDDGSEVWVQKTSTDDTGVAKFDLDALGAGKRYIFKAKPYGSWVTSAVASQPGWLGFRVGKLQVQLLDGVSGQPLPNHEVTLKRANANGTYDWIFNRTSDANGWLRIDPPAIGTEAYVLEAPSPTGHHTKRSDAYTTPGPHVFKIGNPALIATVRNNANNAAIGNVAVEAWELLASGQSVLRQSQTTNASGAASFDLDGIGEGRNYVLKTQPYMQQVTTAPISSAGQFTVIAGKLNVRLVNSAKDTPYAYKDVTLFERQADNSLQFVGIFRTDVDGRLRLDPTNLGSRPYVLRAPSLVDGKNRESADYTIAGSYQFRVGGDEVQVGVIDHVSDTRMPGIEVHAKLLLNDGTEVWVDKQTTAADGIAHFDLDGLNEGKNYVFQAKPFGSWVTSQKLTQPGWLGFRVGKLQVQLLDGVSGQPLPNHEVTLKRANANGTYDWIFNRTSDANGWLRIDPPAIGTEAYVLEAPSPTGHHTKRSDAYTTPGPHVFKIGNPALIATVRNNANNAAIGNVAVEAWELLASGQSVLRQSQTTNASGAASFDLDGIGEGRNYVLKTQPYMQQVTTAPISSAGQFTVIAGKLNVRLVNSAKDTPYAYKDVTLFERQADNSLQFVGIFRTDVDGRLRLDPTNLGSRPYVLRAPSLVDGKNRESADYTIAGSYQFRVGGDEVQVGVIDHVSDTRMPGIEVHAKLLLNDGTEVWVDKQTTAADGIAHFDLDGLNEGKNYVFQAKPFGSWVTSQKLTQPGWLGFRVGTSPITVIETAAGLPIVGQQVNAFEKTPDGKLHHAVTAVTDGTGLIRLDLVGLGEGREYMLQTYNPFGKKKYFRSGILMHKGPFTFQLTKDMPESPDLLPPYIKIIAPGSGARIASGGLSLHGIANDNERLDSVTLTFHLPSGDVVSRAASFHRDSGTWNVVSGALPDEQGTVIVTATAADGAQNEGTDTLSLELVRDNTAPTISIDEDFPDGQVPLGAFVLSGRIKDDTLGSKLSATLTESGQVKATRTIEVHQESGRWAMAVSTHHTSGDSITVDLVATDSAGNEADRQLQLIANERFEAVWHVLQRTSFGPTLHDYRSVSQTGASPWISQQLNPESISDAAYTERTASWGGGNELGTFALRRMAYSDRQLEEVMTWFWENHFNTNASTHQVDTYEITENEGFRNLALGNFRQILEYSAKSPAMLYTLDNMFNVRKHANENYARELLELHTLGINGGYTQADVEAAARAFTGWTVENGEFVFRSETHDTGEKQILGQIIPEDGGIDDGYTVLDIVASHPATGYFICEKLIEVFVADTPQPSLLFECANVFSANSNASDQIRRVLATIFSSTEFSSVATHRNKIKTPLEYSVGVLRMLDADRAGDDVVTDLKRQGMSLFRNPVPTGYPETGSHWLGSHMLLSRSRFVDALLTETTDGGKASVDLLELTMSDGCATAEAVSANLLERAMGPHFSDLHLALVSSLLTEDGKRPYFPDEPDAEIRLRRIAKAVLSMPDAHYQ